MLGEWERWMPIDGILGKYDIEYIVDGNKGLIIRVYSDKDTKKIDIIFQHYADAYRHTNESFWFITCSELTAQYGSHFYGDWSFFKVRNSDYLAWLSDRSGGFADQLNFIHFCIMGGDSVVEILAQYEPTVRFVQE